MGEYVVWNGRVVKVGTCEDLFYTRYEDFRRLVDDGAVEYHPGNAQPAAYLRGEYRFRFPFLDEDTDAAVWPINGYDNFDRGYTVLVPYHWMAGEIEHGDAHATVTGPYGAELPEPVRRRRAALRIPCPQSGQDVPGLSFEHGGWYHVEIVQQRPFDGALWLICRCPFCGTRWRVPPDAAKELYDVLRGPVAPPELWEIAERLWAGYSTATDTPGA